MFTKTFSVTIDIACPAALCDEKVVENEIQDALCCMKSLMRRWVNAERLAEPIRVAFVGEAAIALEGVHAGEEGTVVSKHHEDGTPIWTVAFKRGTGQYHSSELTVVT